MSPPVWDLENFRPMDFFDMSVPLCSLEFEKGAAKKTFMSLSLKKVR